MSGTELIMGMGEVINYLKELEAENKKLKEEINGDGFLKQGYKTELSNSHKQQNRMVKEIVKLEEENKKLNEMIPTGTVYSQNVIVEYQQKVKLLEGEIKKLQKMIKYLPNDMEDKWWCEKNERWRWADDGFEEEEEESESESE